MPISKIVCLSFCLVFSVIFPLNIIAAPIEQKFKDYVVLDVIDNSSQDSFFQYYKFGMEKSITPNTKVGMNAKYIKTVFDSSFIFNVHAKKKVSSSVSLLAYSNYYNDHYFNLNGFESGIGLEKTIWNIDKISVFLSYYPLIRTNEFGHLLSPRLELILNKVILNAKLVYYFPFEDFQNELGITYLVSKRLSIGIRNESRDFRSKNRSTTSTFVKYKF